MRLTILDSGHGLGTRVLFALIRAISRQPVLDVIKLVKYRPDFYGRPMQRVTHEAMRGPSAWSVGDRELMAAFIAKTNECEWCTKAHVAVAERAYGGGTKVCAAARGRRCADPRRRFLAQPAGIQAGRPQFHGADAAGRSWPRPFR